MTDWSHVKHFRRHEFGHHDDIEPDDRLVEILDAARDLAGIPFSITSGIRSPERNAEVGGVSDSAHITGHAVDIRCTTSRDRALMLATLLKFGANRVGIGRTFLHVDTDPGKPNDVIWLYD